MTENRIAGNSTSTPETQTSRWTILLAWTIVTIPLAWGVYQSLVKSLPLFRS